MFAIADYFFKLYLLQYFLKQNHTSQWGNFFIGKLYFKCLHKVRKSDRKLNQKIITDDHHYQNLLTNSLTLRIRNFAYCLIWVEYDFAFIGINYLNFAYL